MNINEVLSTCLSNMKASEDLNDVATVSSIKDLLSCIIENPAILINCPNEENLSIVISSILTCQFPSDHPTYKDFNVRNLVFATSYYLCINLKRACFMIGIGQHSLLFSIMDAMYLQNLSLK